MLAMLRSEHRPLPERNVRSYIEVDVRRCTDGRALA